MRVLAPTSVGFPNEMASKCRKRSTRQATKAWPFGGTLARREAADRNQLCLAGAWGAGPRSQVGPGTRAELDGQMPLAPELRGAFLFGEGVHGYAKPDGHYMDDLWFYDVHGHRWVCCYPGADTKSLDLTINADGFEATRDGGPLPVATMGHGYEMTTYD